MTRIAPRNTKTSPYKDADAEHMRLADVQHFERTAKMLMMLPH